VAGLVLAAAAAPTPVVPAHVGNRLGFGSYDQTFHGVDQAHFIYLGGFWKLICAEDPQIAVDTLPAGGGAVNRTKGVEMVQETL
jgi:hypothetical protein